MSKFSEEMRDTVDVDAMPSHFVVQVRDKSGRFVQDPFADYQRGRARAPLRSKLCCASGTDD